MEAAELLSRLKADSPNVVHLDTALEEYRRTAAALRGADGSTLAANVLCMMCRNLEKVSGWRERADPGTLLRLCVAATGDLRCVGTERTRVLAALYHLHRYATKQNTPPDLVLRLSAYVFSDNEKELLAEYCKTYWAILGDKLTYIEKLKADKLNVKKLIGNLTNDVKKTVYVYRTVNFCQEYLVVLVKKLYHIFSDSAPQGLNDMFVVIFESFLAKDDLEGCANKLTVSASLDLYRKVNDCFNVIVENASKVKFDNCAFTVCVRFAKALFGYQPSMVHCLNVFYMESYCKILTSKRDTSLEKLLDMVAVAIESAENKFEMIANETYPFLNQIVRTHVESAVRDYDKQTWTEVFTIEAQNAYLKVIAILMKKLRNSPQVLRCVDCIFKSGLHDALRLSFSIRNFVTNSLKHDMDITATLPQICASIDEQRTIIGELLKGNCVNAEKCRFKAQTDAHNNAILLFRSRKYVYSIRLFDLYIRGEIAMYSKVDYSEKISLSRAFYNKAICELDMCKYDSALRSAFLSLALTDENGLNSDKNMSLVIDIKSKALTVKKALDTSEACKECEEDPLQTTSVLDACAASYEEGRYGDLRPLFCSIEFSVLLQHEMRGYARLWPSLQPLAGACGALHSLLAARPPWARAECRESVLRALCGAAATVPCVARTVHHPRLAAVAADLLRQLEPYESKSLQLGVARATVLFLQAEYDIAEAKNKFGWRAAKNNTDTGKEADSAPPCPTLPQEHQALTNAFAAVDAWTRLLPRLTARGAPADSSSRHTLHNALRVASSFVPQLTQYGRPLHATQLAHVCAELAALLGDHQLQLRSLGAILCAAPRGHRRLHGAMRAAAPALEAALSGEQTRETALVYLCEAAMYHEGCGERAQAAALLRYVQLSVLAAENASETTGALELACGRLLDAQARLCGGARDAPRRLTALNAAHRHYLQLRNTGGTAWWERRQRGAWLSARLAAAGVMCAGAASRVLLCRRARAAAAPALRSAAAAGAARLHAALAACNVAASDAQVKIDTIKSILDVPSLKHNAAETKLDEISPILEPMRDLQISISKTEPIEAVLDAPVLKKTQTGLSSPYFDVAAFAVPEFLSHVKHCQCYACQNPWHMILSLELAGLQAAAYFRSEEQVIATNYFSGTLKMFKFVDAKIDHLFDNYKSKNYEDYVLEIVQDIVSEELVKVKVQILMEYAFFLIADTKYEEAHQCIEEIKQMMKVLEEDLYLNNEVLNLNFALEYLRNKVSKSTEANELSIESEFEGLKLSPNPVANLPIPITPNVKVDLPKVTKPKIMISAEDLKHVKRKVKPLNLDENNPIEETTETKKTNKFFKSKEASFKIPVPKTTQAIPEIITTQRTTRNSKVPVKSKNRLASVESIEKSTIEKTSIDASKCRTRIKKTGSSDSDNDNQKSVNKSKIQLKSFRSVDTAIAASKSEPNLCKSAVENSFKLDNPPNSEQPSKEPKVLESPDMFDEDVFYTPMKPDEEQFFTPMCTTVKTYAKKSLRHQIVKNLETEFQTPQPPPRLANVLPPTDTPHMGAESARSRKGSVEISKGKSVPNKTNPKATELKTPEDKINLGTSKLKPIDVINAKTKAVNDKTNGDTSNLKPVADKKSMRRATSPGKLAVEADARKVRPVRGTRIQQFRAEKLKLSPDVPLQSNIGGKRNK